jgi:hypothetical protein
MSSLVPRTPTSRKNAKNGKLLINSRLNCYQHCNDAFFPQLNCQPLEWVDMFYNNNRYNDVYLFSRPDVLINGV